MTMCGLAVGLVFDEVDESHHESLLGELNNVHDGAR
jgi:hypothetical protein